MFVYPENKQGNLYGTAMINILERYTKRSERWENTTYMGKEEGTKKNSGGHPIVNESDDFEIENGPLDIKSILDGIGHDKNSDEEDLEEAERIAMEEMGLKSSRKKKSPAKKPTRKKKSPASSNASSVSEKPKKRSVKKKPSKKKGNSSSTEES